MTRKGYTGGGGHQAETREQGIKHVEKEGENRSWDGAYICNNVMLGWRQWSRGMRYRYVGRSLCDRELRERNAG